MMRPPTLLIKTQRSASGFALVIALSIMAFVVLLVATISSFVVVEQQSSHASRNQLAAKQNALTAMNVAIGELQRYIGPDQRATASADILSFNNNPYTLVWHSDSTMGWVSQTKDWFASAGDPDFSLPLLSIESARLASLINSEGILNEAAFADPVELMTIIHPTTRGLTSLKGDKIPVSEADGIVTGHYAWVAQDESLKANLKTEHGDYQNTNSVLDLVETSRRLSVFPYANATGVTFADEGNSPLNPFVIDPVLEDGYLNPAYFDKIKNATSLYDLVASGILQATSSQDDTDTSTAELLAPYGNHFTLNSKGLLVDSKNGGLRRDLSRGLDDQYFEKLHGIPVFGVDREGNVIADGINEPIGDQWKFFRDYYNFYRPTDEGLATDLGDKRNTFHGLSDATKADPTIRMRFTHIDLARGLSFMFDDLNGARYGNETPIYSSVITPKTPANQSNPKREGTVAGTRITNDDWFLLTPAIRPVVLRNTLKLGFSFSEITTESMPSLRGLNDINVGKYILSFESYPIYTIWNPFNVAIDLSPSNSQNPLAEGEFIEFRQSGNINIQIQVESGGASTIRDFQLHRNIPNVQLGRTGLSDAIPPGAVLVFGLTQSYTSDSNSFATVQLAPYASGSSVSELNKVSYLQEDDQKVLQVVFDAAGNPVQETNSDGSPKFDDNGDPIWKTTLAYQPIFFEPTDRITLLEAGNQKFNNSLEWSGRIHSGGDSYTTFYLGQNSDLPKPEYVDTDIFLGNIEDIPKGLFPLITINFNANTTGNQGSFGVAGYNPSFPAFSQVNFLGSFPQVVAEADGVGDVKALYHRERFNATADDFSNIFPDNDGDGNGYFGTSFSSAGAKRITLYDLPRHPIVSIGDFRNLTLGWNEDSHARPIGASWPLATLRDLSKPYIRSVAPNGYNTGIWSERTKYFDDGAGCDTSYFYNDELFDQYFFSGIPASARNEDSKLKEKTFPYDQTFGQDYINSRLPLANTRLSFFQNIALNSYYKTNASILTPEHFGNSSGNFDGYLKSAAHLMIDAPFNINSTSPKAWQAILSGFRNQSVSGVDNKYDSISLYEDKGSPFVDNFVPSGNMDDLYAGHRRLDDDQMKGLAGSLVENIRGRGVAKTLGNFVNRDLYGVDTVQKMSRIDAAIKSQRLNSIDNATTSGDDRYASTDSADINRSARMFGDSIIEESAAGLPGYLKQQDILRALSPIMTTRGDTFKIRAYGEVLNPINGKVEGKAWCEVIVQRIPDYVDSTMPPWDMPDDQSYADSTQKVNTSMGRRLKIIQFRWLDKNEVI